MERTAIAGMRQCLLSGRGLRCVTQTLTPRCIATAICPARKVANTAGISSTSTSTSVRGESSTSVPAMIKNRLADTTSVMSRKYSSTSSPSSSNPNNESSPQGTIGSGSSGIPSESERSKDLLTAPPHLREAEKEIWDLLNKELQPKRLEVKDVSGGCGSMYAIDVVSERFRGLGMLKQQRLVNAVLGERVKAWHGVQMKTGVP